MRILPAPGDIAVIGMSCRLPGNISTPEAYWELLKNKVDAIEDIPKERWDFGQFYDPEKNTKGKMYTRQGGFLRDVEKFDNVFFKISPLETESLDPQVRIILELSYEAFEHAGIDTGKLAGSSTGVFIGLTIVDYIEKDIRSNNPAAINAYSVMGTQTSSASGRISYAYGLEGPSISLDTACSSSLTTVHLACQSLLTGESNLAVAGGVNLILSPKYHVAFCELGALADDCRSKAFDASANGFVRSEGAGLVILKRLEDARRDKDNILAVICGSGITNDGASKGYTVPKMEAQAKAIHIALNMAGVEPDDIGYYETHGTGTSVGDPIEMEGIVSVFKDRKIPSKLYAGSAKTNIGHCESAAGIAGLQKCILALQHKLIPPNLHFNVPNPAIKWDTIPVAVPTEAIDWSSSDHPRYASVSAFGLSGTNVTIIVREGEKSATTDELNIEREIFMLPVSAATTTAVHKLARSYADLLSASEGDKWKEICVAAALHRSHLGCRYIASGSSRQQIIDNIEASLQNDKHIFNNVSKKKVVFVFPGQGAQWIGMGRELMEKENAFRAKMIECDKAISQYTTWSLLTEIKKDGADNRFHEVDVIQPVLFAVYVSLASLWQSWGITPDVVLGHSLGEVAAAHIAGVLSIEDAAAIICKRSALAKTTSGEGSMALTELSYEDALKRIRGYEDEIAIGACNGPLSTVISGSAGPIDKILAKLNEEGVFNKLINVDYASHSPHMDKLKDQLLKQLHNIQPVKGTIPIYSTVVNKIIDGDEMDAQYWSDNLRKTVLFAQAIETLLNAGDCVFIEVSPHPILLQLVDQAIEYYNKPSSCSVFSTKREIAEQEVMLDNFKYAYQAGATIDWAKYYKRSRVPHHYLPFYPWQRDRFWIDSTVTSHINNNTGNGHPFLYKETKFADDKKNILWEGAIDLNTHRFLADHKVKGTVIFPAAGYIDLILASIKKSYGTGLHKIRNINYLQPITLDLRPKNIQIIFKKQRTHSILFEIFSAFDNETNPEWELNCSGDVLLFTDASDLIKSIDLTGISDYPRHFTRNEHYTLMTSGGVQYGERFQAVDEVWATQGNAIGKIVVPDKIKDFTGAYQFHPALLDACFQVCVASMNLQQHDEEAYLPYSIGSFYIEPGSTINGNLWVNVRNSDNESSAGDIYSRNIEVYDEEQKIIASITDFKFKKLKDQDDHLLQDAYYKFKWNLVTPEPPIPLPRTILIFEETDQLTSAFQTFEWNQPVVVVRIRPGDEFSIIDGKITEVVIQPKKKEQLIRLLNELVRRNIRYSDILFAWGLTTKTMEVYQHQNFEMDFVYLIQALNEKNQETFKRLTLVTAGVHQVLEGEHVNAFNAPLLGIARVAAHEHPEFNCRRIDLSLDRFVEPGILCNLFLNGSAEREFAIRGDKLYVPRLERVDTSGIAEQSKKQKKKIPAGNYTPYRFVTDEPGVLENIYAKEIVRHMPVDDEIEVEVKAVGLNFMNVMSALGIYPGCPKGFRCLGVEFSGIVRNIGKKVTTLAIGDHVIGLSPVDDCLGKYIICNILNAIKIPKQLDFTDAATLGVAYGTAYGCLVVHANLKKDERVLIHSATGGVGLAAIEVARHAGAEIYATAGSEEKRRLLREMGIKYVMDSHSLDFVEEIRKYTNNEGIDVVLNSLAGEAMFQSMKLLRGFGRFLEIGKKDIYENNNLKMDIFKQSITYTFFDLHKILNERPELTHKHLNAVLDHFSQGHYKIIPKKVFDASHVLDGFDLMTRGQHVGKIVFDMKTDGLMIEPMDKLFNENETYLITGGMGGLGFALAEWMCSKGASHIVLAGRNLPDKKREQDIEVLRDKDKNIVIETADISNIAQVEKLLSKIRSSMPPLAGVFHAAGSLSDSSLANLSHEQYDAPVGSKIYGSWNLHSATAGDNLKYFVLFSSAASPLGSIGQANYVAGNAFLDSLSKERQATGKPVTCINWGPIAEIGLAAQDEIRGKRLHKEGITSLTQSEYIAALEFVLTNKLTDVSILHLNYDKWVDHNPTYAIDSLLSELADKTETAAENSFVQELKACISADQAALMMQTAVKEILASILKSSPEKIDIDLPFANLGLDSLMAIQLRNKLQKLTGLQISVTVFWNYSKVRMLSDFLLKELGITKPAQETISENANGLGEWHIDNMSEDEVLSQLDLELSNISIDEKA